jgi:hypothetical protein
VIKYYKIRLLYNTIVSNDQTPLFLRTFCKKFLPENVVLVKVEMASKAITRSIKDKRFNFAAQLSSLGKD